MDGWGLHLQEMDSLRGSLAFPLWLRSGPFPARTSTSSRCWKVRRPWVQPWRLCAAVGWGGLICEANLKHAAPQKCHQHLGRDSFPPNLCGFFLEVWSVSLLSPC